MSNFRKKYCFLIPIIKICFSKFNENSIIQIKSFIINLLKQISQLYLPLLDWIGKFEATSKIYLQSQIMH